MYYCLLSLLLITRMIGSSFCVRRIRKALIPNKSIPASEQPEVFPKAVILISLRGDDPGLADSLRAFINQDYPNFSLKIVIDGQTDPAWEIAQAVVAEHPQSNVTIEELTERRSTCSLKCSALVQAIQQFDDTVEIVALADADVQANPNWLRLLTQPFSDPSVGATFGNRWFTPKSSTLGSDIRALWNAAAMVQMYHLSIPWGGTLAIRHSSIRDSNLIEKWSNSIVDDAPITRSLKELNQHGKFVPELIMVNQEQCDLKYCFNFISRQLTWVRMYHPGWSRVVMHALFVTSFEILVGFGLVFGLLTQQHGMAVMATAAYLLLMAVNMVNYRLLTRSIKRTVGSQASKISRIRFVRYLQMMLISPIVASVHASAIVSAQIAKRIKWRGITYQLLGPWNIRLVNYRPFSKHSAQGNTNTSL